MTAWRCFCVCRGSALCFFWRRRIGAMADCRHHGEGEHHQGNVAMPIVATEDRLLPPRARIASGLCPHPTSFTLLISEQTFQKQACIRRNTLLPEQRTYPRLDLPKRRRP